jgi:hypothetical protein
MKRNHGLAMTTVLGLLLGACGSAMAAENPNKLRSEMAKAEQDYIALYNKLNTDREFDIVCVTDRPTGSSIPVQTCQARYLLHAKAAAATERMQSAVAAGQSTGPANATGANVGATAGGGAMAGRQDKLQAFRQNMLDILQKSPELQALGKQRDELQKRYNEAMKGRGNSSR